ncbi:MAG: aldolase catalytic domain-containing protein [Bacillus cereus]|jgi:4-hydroxy 2-oxovalerate aldolase|nr:aldolase catalytic domain-containing protein [Bacillus cereus]
MNIKILDCTLRDGGYINNFQFGGKAIRKIIYQLTDANIDVIECGFLEDGDYNENTSLFVRVEQIKPFIPENRKTSIYVAMACYGEYSLENLSDYDGTSIDGVRVTFHYNEIDDALAFCQQIKDKGYKIFIQPVGTTSYTDEKLIGLINKVNQIQPYAFYLVDTLGLMSQDDVLRMYYLINNNLAQGIKLGFHSHNNLQLSFSNCQALTRLKTKRTIILDSSVYGMGRGAGNLNTELITSYLNREFNFNYSIEPLLEIIDEFILKIKEQSEWGYTVPYYLAAINGCHPNYASYLNSKQTLPIKSISIILRSIEPENRSLYHREVIEQKYRDYQDIDIDDNESLKILEKSIGGNNVLLVAPGYSLLEYESNIIEITGKEKCIVISVGFVPDFMEVDYVFLSNLKRYNTTFNPNRKNVNLIYTSNIRLPKEERGIAINYSSFLDKEDSIIDNAGMMLLNLLIKLNPEKLYIAGLDGYSLNKNNYYRERLNFTQDAESLIERNSVIKNKIKNIKNKLDIEFITPSLYTID